MSDQEDFDDEMMEVDPSQGAANDSDENDSNENDSDENDSEFENNSENESDSDDAGDEEELSNKYLEILTQIQADGSLYDNYVQLVQVAK